MSVCCNNKWNNWINSKLSKLLTFASLESIIGRPFLHYRPHAILDHVLTTSRFFSNDPPSLWLAIWLVDKILLSTLYPSSSAYGTRPASHLTVSVTITSVTGLCTNSEQVGNPLKIALNFRPTHTTLQLLLLGGDIELNLGPAAGGIYPCGYCDLKTMAYAVTIATSGFIHHVLKYAPPNIVTLANL